jgi:hypothetical protein
MYAEMWAGCAEELKVDGVGGLRRWKRVWQLCTENLIQVKTSFKVLLQLKASDFFRKLLRLKKLPQKLVISLKLFKSSHTCQENVKQSQKALETKKVSKLAQKLLKVLKLVRPPKRL